MITPATVFAWIAYLTFVALLVLDFWIEFNVRRTIIFGVLCLAGFVGLRFIPGGELFFAPYVACLAVALAFRVFYGDVRLR